MPKLQKVIFFLFALLFFFVPLILWPFTSEVFEFNKMVLVYALTVLIVASWAVRTIYEGKFIFRRTILDKPLLIFLGSQLIATVLSLDPLTSWLGYYSRYNGGLISSVCYSLLYWAFVSNFDKDDAIKLINYAFLPSAALVALYGVAEHFGIDKNIWVQDVQSRVFSTLGQPNWLAAWLVALMPISWAFLIDSKLKSPKFWLNLSLSILFFWTLIFTKSRSGLLGVAVAFAVFWGLYFWSNKKQYKKLILPFGVIGFSILAVCLISGTELTPSLINLITKPGAQQTSLVGGDTALETGGTESGTIRKIVWKGAVDVWKHYPVFGTGVETFAFSYYKFRPVEHNLTSEWDFIYNKAHNEFLNMAANSGTVGIAAYLFVIGAICYLIFTAKSEYKTVNFALLGGFVSLSVTNFFGFSVVPTQMEFFLFPAFAVALATNLKAQEKDKSKSTTALQTISAVSILLFAIYLLVVITRYWMADTAYAKGKAYNGAAKPDVGANYLIQAISYEPGQAIYHGELASSYTSLALYYNQKKDAENSKKFTDSAIGESDKAISLSPANVNLKRARFGIFIMLSSINPNYLIDARDTLTDAITQAPTDAKLYYNLGLVYARTGDLAKAEQTFKTTIELKSNYKEPRLALSYLLIDKKQNAEAKTQLEYILKNIDPNDSLTKQALESIK